jgi:excisionase family DNA binding protein
MAQLMDVREAAQHLGVSPHRVRQLIEQGDLKAQRVGRFWVLDRADVRRRAVLDVPDGRPYAARQVWRMGDLADVLAEGESHAGLASALNQAISRQDRWQLRRYLADLATEDDTRNVAWRLRDRSDRVVERYAHPSVLEDLVDDPRVVVSGAHAAAGRGEDLVPDAFLQAYLAQEDVGQVVADHGLIEVSDGPNVRLRVADEVGAWRDRRANLHPDKAPEFAPSLLVIADLAERDDARAASVADAMWARLRGHLRGPTT